MVKLLMVSMTFRSGSDPGGCFDIRSFTAMAYGIILAWCCRMPGCTMPPSWKNIRYGRFDATDEEVYQAARTANVVSLHPHTTEGYNMVLDEETSNISQDKDNCSPLARAVLQTSILILDEATSSVIPVLKC
jgi:ATP-binding cassette subfamily B protein